MFWEGLDMLESDNGMVVDAELSLRVIELRRIENQFYLERDFNHDLWIESNEIRDAALACKRAYDDMMDSYAIRLLLKARRMAGRDYQRLYASVPLGCKGEPFCLDESSREWVEALPNLVAEMPKSFGGSYFKKSNLKIGIITDNFMYNYYKDAATFIELTPIDYKMQLATEGFDLVLYVSAWQGLGHYGEIPAPENFYYAGPDGVKTACEVLECAKQHGIPTVFQTIEDPPCYDRFLPIARCADVVFTSAEEMIDKYKVDLGHERV